MTHPKLWRQEMKGGGVLAGGEQSTQVVGGRGLLVPPHQAPPRTAKGRHPLLPMTRTRT